MLNRGKEKISAKRLKKYKKSGALLASLALVLFLGVGSTLAYIIATTDSLTNVFHPVKVEAELVEDFDRVNNRKSSIQIKNSGDIAVYVRATLAIYWTDGAGVIVEPEYCSYTPNPIVYNTTNWFKVGEVYYYKHKLEKNTMTENLLTTENPIEVEIVPTEAYYRLNVDVLYETIQADPAAAVESAWVKVNVDSSGNLVAAGS